eukprot:5410424-Heterocapsa_arctica.AAC.1
MHIVHQSHTISFHTIDVAGQAGNVSYQATLGLREFLVAAVGAGGQVTIRGAGERAHIIVMSPSWLVVTNPEKLTNIARDQGYCTLLHVSIQQACDTVAMLTPTKRVICQLAPKWPKEERSYTPSQGPPPIQIHESNQAFDW